MKLLVVIVNYKTADLALRALASALPDVKTLGARVTVVDNASGDGSPERLKAGIAALPDASLVELVVAEKNGGFGYGNNLAIRRALASSDPPELVYLLNPDAVADPGAIQRLVAFMDSHPECGIAGTHITDVGGTTHVSAFRFPSPLGEVEGTLRLGVATKVLQKWSVWSNPCDRTCQVDWVSGASSIIRREVLEGVGLFDENFFLYFEETDLCRRAAEAGWQTWFVREASVEHLRAAATGLKDVAKPMPAYWFQSRRYYFLKQGGSRELWLANLAWLTGQSLWRLRRRIQRKPDVDPPNLLFDFLRHNVAAARAKPKR
ncbi:MAG TPA: glycosyltransferase family 2 protein [Nannocystaceae bacterium]|nr:glycosyltransferase family 2 protein [Nannocystaceae bacterium]